MAKTVYVVVEAGVDSIVGGSSICTVRATTDLGIAAFIKTQLEQGIDPDSNTVVKLFACELEVEV